MTPSMSPDTQFFWDGLKEHRLLIQRCRSCLTLRHPPRPMCPTCDGTGAVSKTRTLEVRIPKGVKTGSRVRIAGDTRVAIDVRRLLLESTRHLPATYLSSRFADTSEQLELAQANGQQPSLLPAEAFVLSRINGPTTVNELLSVSGMNAAETLQSLYALAICGVVKRAAWATPQFEGSAGAKATVKSEANADEQLDTLEDFFARVELTANYYDLLGVDQKASGDEVKNAYHSLARRYHPDRNSSAEAAERAQAITSAIVQRPELGAGAVLANVSLFVMQKFVAGASEAGVPYWVFICFWLGSACCLVTIGIAMIRTKEIQPSDRELAEIRAASKGIGA